MALGCALLPGASGEGGPGRPEGRGAVAWDTIPAARQWPSNQSSATRVSRTQGSALEAGLKARARAAGVFVPALQLTEGQGFV